MTEVDQSPVRLEGLFLDGYKCFARPEGFALKPLSLLYGRNNAGKSALLRALAILSRSVAESAAGPWDMGDAEGPGRGAPFRGLAWRGRARHDFSIILQWSWGGATSFDRLRLDQDDPTAPAYIREVHVGLPAMDSVPSTSAEAWLRIPPEEGGTAEYVRQSDEKTTRLLFDGLVPALGQSPQLDALAERLKTLRHAVQWLHGSRTSAPLDVPLSGTSARLLKPDGSNAALKLVAEQGRLLDDVRAFYAHPVFGRDLTIQHYRDSGARLLLDRPGEPWRIQLADVGEGMGKVLPVLVAIAAAARGSGPRIVVIEDPDVHLHDDGVRTLVEWIVDRVASNPAVRVVLETHSETVKLAAQNVVRRSDLKPEQLGLVWSERQADGHTRVEPVPLNEAGMPESHVFRSAFRVDRLLAAELAGFDPPRRPE